MSLRRSTLALVVALIVLAAGVLAMVVRRDGDTRLYQASAAAQHVGGPTSVPPRRSTTSAPAPSSTVPPSTTTTLPATTTTPPPQPPPAVAEVIAAGGRATPIPDPVALADQVLQVERVIRDPASPPDWVEAAGRLQQLAYRVAADHPEWDPIFLGALPPELHDAASRHLAARREFRSMHTRLSDHLPAWRIVDPLPADELMALYQEAEARFGVPWHVLAAVNLVETGMGRIIGLSTAGAQGPMQFMPGTWAAYGMGGDVWNPRDAIMGAANYLAANGAADGTEEGLNNGLFRYNNDNRYVRAVRHYSAIMAADPLTYRGFHAWQIVFLTTLGDVVLPVGYESDVRVPVEAWVAAHGHQTGR